MATQLRCSTCGKASLAANSMYCLCGGILVFLSDEVCRMIDGKTIDNGAAILANAARLIAKEEAVEAAGKLSDTQCTVSQRLAAEVRAKQPGFSC